MMRASGRLQTLQVLSLDCSHVLQSPMQQEEDLKSFLKSRQDVCDQNTGPLANSEHNLGTQFCAELAAVD